MYGAIILPTLAEVLPKPIPTFLTTVGKTSLLYKYIVGKLIAIPTRPSEAKNTRTFALVMRIIKSKLTPDNILPPIKIFKRDTRDIKTRTIIVPGISMAAASDINSLSMQSHNLIELFYKNIYRIT